MVGRYPHDCDAARSGLRPIRIDVRANGMSRAHLEIRRVDGRVFIIDRQSRNGVAIRPAGQTQWTRIAPWRPIVWLPGMSVRIGSRILRLEAAGQRPTVRNEPITPITVRMAKPANSQGPGRAAAAGSHTGQASVDRAGIDRTMLMAANAAPPSSASTVRINHAGGRGHAIAAHNGAARTRRSAMRELFTEAEMISATVQPPTRAAPRKTGPVAATSGRDGA